MRAVAFMGELTDIGVADLVQLLGLKRQTGKLTISANGEEIALYLEDGRLVLVSSSDLALRLGRMLIRLGLIDPDQVRQALEEQEARQPDRAVGRILIDRGWLSEADLARCVEEQCIHALAQVISVGQGAFVWTRDVTVPRRVEAVPLNADRVLLEAIRRTDELATLRDLLPRFSAPLLLCGWFDEVAPNLTDEEVLVAAALQTTAGSLAELLVQLALDEMTVCRTVVAMRARGLILAGQEPVVELAVNGAIPPDTSADRPTG
jgi:hypothetical protein